MRAKIKFSLMILSTLFFFIPASEISGHHDSLIRGQIEKNMVDSSTIEEQLKRIKYKKFINKPIGELLEHINTKYERILFVQLHPFKLAFVSVIYSKEISLDIYTEDYQFIKRVRDENESEDIWKIEDLLKENVTKIRLRRRDGTSGKEFPKEPILQII